MVVKTAFSQYDFERILSQYDLGTYSGSKAVKRRTVKTNYIVQTTQGKYVLRYYENRSRESVLFEIDSERAPRFPEARFFGLTLKRAGLYARVEERADAMIEAGLIEPIVFVGNLDSIRTFADVRDIVRNVMRALLFMWGLGIGCL